MGEVYQQQTTPEDRHETDEDGDRISDELDDEFAEANGTAPASDSSEYEDVPDSPDHVSGGPLPGAEREYNPRQVLVDPSKGTDEPPNVPDPDEAAAAVDQVVDEAPAAEAGELDMRDQDADEGSERVETDEVDGDERPGQPAEDSEQ